MLVMSRGALSAGQAETYYEEKYSQDDYYTEDIESPVSGSDKALRRSGSPVKSLPKIFARYFAANGRTPPRFSSQRQRTNRTAGRMGRDL